MNALNAQGSHADGQQKNKHRGRRNLWIAAAAIWMALLSLVALQALTPTANTYTTSVGEQHVFELSDGSVVYLNARSRVKVNLSRNARDIQLAAGEALFKVAHDPTRPFRVHVDGAVIQAIGTEFNVYRHASGAVVSVVEGAVRVGGRDLRAGEEANVNPTGEVAKLAKADTAKAVAWRQRRLVFKEDRLADIAAEFNRYNRSPQIRIESNALSERRLTGVFDADAPESLLHFLAGAADITISRDGSDVHIRARSVAE